MHGLVTVHRDDDGQVAVGDAVETMHADDAVERGAADPGGIRVRLHGLEHVAASDAGAGIDRMRSEREVQAAIIEPHHGDHAVGADIRHAVEFADGIDVQGGDDHAGERAIAVVQRARQVDVPLPNQPADRAGLMNILPSSRRRSASARK